MVAIAFASLAARAEVSGIEVASRPDVVADESFDDVGGYAEDQPPSWPGPWRGGMDLPKGPRWPGDSSPA